MNADVAVWDQTDTETPARQHREDHRVEGEARMARTPARVRFAFYGRVSTEDHQDPAASRAWQLRRAHGLIDPAGGTVVAEFFDVDKSRSVPWQRRPQASALLGDLRKPARGFDAVVVGEPHRAFYGNQYSLTFPLFEHFGVPLWVPEVGGPIDPANEAHDMIMGVFGGLSKGERNRIKIRVRSAMAAITATEGRFLGGRPPYGYRLVDAGPHPNPAKAADGKRIQRLVVDEMAATVVQRIFAEFVGLAGFRERGYHSIAEGLNRDGIPCPSAHDPTRNRHRSGAAWSKPTVRTILQNPRYTGYQVWNKQRKDEVLLDVDDIALGHTTKLRWNPRDTWVFSENIVHPVIIDMNVFERAQHKLAHAPRAHQPRHRSSTRCYPLKGVVWCGICGRKMHAHYSNATNYYRCRPPKQDQHATGLTHPHGVYVREDRLLPDLDRWLNAVLAPHRITRAVTAMHPAPALAAVTHAVPEAAGSEVAAPLSRLARHPAAPEAGDDAPAAAPQVTDTGTTAAEKTASGVRAPGAAALSEDEAADLVRRVDALRSAIADADPRARERLYERLGLKVTYHPGCDVVQVEIDFDPSHAASPGFSPAACAPIPAASAPFKASAVWPLAR
ncbi:recombinase family protein [Actinomadura bangladeshensis]|nr:recombinase family protein [Actinomadura bangladeshensis]